MLQNYADKPTENWRSKDAAIYLVTSSASRGQTQKHGVTQSSELVSLPQFAIQHIQPELLKPNGMQNSLSMSQHILELFSEAFNSYTMHFSE